MIRVIELTNGAWPPLTNLIGAEVASVRRHRSRRRLYLEWVRSGSILPEKLEIPHPWVFSSCLISISSSDYSSNDDAGKTEDLPELIGLVGARLTAVESDEKNLDLVFDSIRISVRSHSE